MPGEKKRKPDQQKLDKITLVTILYFISSLDGVLGKTHLQKLLFLTDLIATRKFKKKITVIDYKLYHFGPFSDEIAAYTTHLEKKELITIREYPFTTDPNKTYTRFYIRKPMNVKKKLIGLVGADKFIVLDDVVKSFGNMSLQNVLDVVYNLQIVSEATQNKPMTFAGTITEEELEDTEGDSLLD